MKLSELLPAAPGCRVRGGRDPEIAGISLDSRTVRDGFLFAALKGARADGCDFVDDAVARGAAAVLVHREIPNHGRVAVVTAPDARAALARIADRFYGSPSRELAVTGVTGTNGKTTVCYLARAMLAAAGRSAALLGSVEYLVGGRSIPAERTTPEAPALQAMMREAVRQGCGELLMEVSSHALVQRRVDAVAFRTAVFTNLGVDHLDFHGNRSVYFAAKSILFKLPGLHRAVVNADDPRGRMLAREISAPVTSYGLGEDAGLRARRIETGPHGSRFEMEFLGTRTPVELPLIGRHNVYNALAAAGAAFAAGVGAETIAASLAAAAPVPGRLEEVAAGLACRVFIDYAHTEEALRCALSALRGICAGRLIVVFGCGGDRDRTKRRPMGETAARLADAAIITSDNPRREDPRKIMAEIARGFNGPGIRPAEICDRREAIAAALAGAREGDVVLVAGKGHERTQEIGSTVVPFSDRDVVMALAGKAGAPAQGGAR
jgi:UDP-N-acetylmuramoyl-L-alanyl-D-glutamate--2,6-diaminopimelate ligase